MYYVARQKLKYILTACKDLVGGLEKRLLPATADCHQVPSRITTKEEYKPISGQVLSMVNEEVLWLLAVSVSARSVVFSADGKIQIF